MPGEPGRRSRSRHAGSITSYATGSGQRWKFQIYVPKDPARPERPEHGDTRITRGGFKSLEEAQRVLAEALRKKKSNGLFQVKTPTIGEYAEHWIGGLRLQNSTIQGYQKIIRLTSARSGSTCSRPPASRPTTDSSRPPAAATSSATASRCRQTPFLRSTSCSPPCSTPPSMTG